MKEFYIYNERGDKYIVYADEIMYLEDIVIFRLDGNISSLVNLSNVTIVIEITDKHH